MATQKLNLTRDQLATFLKNHEQIKQFEQLFQIADEISPATDTVGISIQAGNAEASATEALAQIVRLAQDAAINSGAADKKAVEALDTLARIANALEMLATAPVIQNNNSVVTDYIDLRDYGWQPTYRIGRVWFGPTGTLEIAMGNGNITQQVGEEFFKYGKASSAISDTNLQLVYKTGTLGASGVITFAPTVAGITDPDQIVGIATEPIAINGFGRVTTSGVVRSINTTGSVYGEVWADNDDIWYNPVTGGLTKTKPVAPNIKLMVGTVINAGSGGSGSFDVKLGSSSSLGGTDSNVQLGTLLNRQLLQYDSTAGYWRNVVDIGLGGHLILPKTSGYGIKVDPDSPTYGWRDLTADIQVHGTGANDPAFATYTGTTMRAYQFSANTMNEVFFVFHVPHDWVPGTDVYFHAHWSNAAAVPNTGNVVWKFDYQFAKGFGQEAFPAVQTAQVIAASPATRYIHNVSESAAVSIPTMEVDGLILVRGYRDAANVLDTCTDAVFLHTMDIHYQSQNMATKNKAPNFYA